MKQSKTYSRMEAPSLQLHLPLLISGYGGLNSLSFELCNKSYLDNKLSYYIKGSSMVADFSENTL